MLLSTSAIVCAVLPHGEAGAVVRLLTPADGLRAGYVRGGRSRRLRPVLQPGNLVAAEFRARTDAQLAALTVELVASRAPLMAEPLAAAAIEWACALAATLLPEGQPYPLLFAALDGTLAAIESAPSARGWAAGLVRYEFLVLRELGFGLDLSHCVVTGQVDDLAFVSPRSGGAVSRAAGEAHAGRLLALPRFLVAGGAAGVSVTWPDVTAGLALTGHFLSRELLGDRRGAALLPARQRLVERIARIAG